MMLFVDWLGYLTLVSPLVLTIGTRNAILQSFRKFNTVFSEIRVWTLNGDVLYTLSGHTSFAYSVAVLPSGDLVSAGEDRSVRVWRGSCSDTVFQFTFFESFLHRWRVHSNYHTPSYLGLVCVNNA